MNLGIKTCMTGNVWHNKYTSYCTFQIMLLNICNI